VKGTASVGSLHHWCSQMTSVQCVILLGLSNTTAGGCCWGLKCHSTRCNGPRSDSRGRLLCSCHWDVEIVGGKALFRVVVDIHVPRRSSRWWSRGLRAFPELSAQPVSAGSLSRVLLSKHAPELLPFFDGLRWCKLRRWLHPTMFGGRAGRQECDLRPVVFGSLSQGAEILIGQEGDYALIVRRVGNRLRPSSPVRHRRRCLICKHFQLAIGFPRCDELSLPFSAAPGPAFAPHQQNNNNQERRSGDEHWQWHAVVIWFIDDDDWWGEGDVCVRRFCSTQGHVARPAADVHPMTEAWFSVNRRGEMGRARVFIQRSAPAWRAHRTRVILPSTLQAAAHFLARAALAAFLGGLLPRTVYAASRVRTPGVINIWSDCTTANGLVKCISW
jgi:hypothetical protein